MTGTTMLDLAETSPAKQRLHLPASRTLPRWHADVTREIATHLSPAHAALLALPVQTGAGWVWRAPGIAWCRFDALTAPDRRALTRSIGVILSDIRRLGESGRGPAVAEAGPSLCDVPDWDHIYAVDGRPVLVAWGHCSADAVDGGSAGLPARLDDGIPDRGPPPPPWPVYWRALLALLLVALVTGLLLPFIVPQLLPAAAACTAAPGQLAILKEQNRAAERGRELHSLLIDLDEQAGRRRLQCPIRQAPAPTTAATPQPHAALPRERWDRHDLDMLEGCWTNTTDMKTRNEQTHAITDIKSWRICFDQSGHGHQTIVWVDGGTCDGPLAAQFNTDNTLTLTDVSRCTGNRSTLYRGRMACRRTSDDEAICDRVDVEGPGRGAHQQGKFRR